MNRGLAPTPCNWTSIQRPRRNFPLHRPHPSECASAAQKWRPVGCGERPRPLEGFQGAPESGGSTWGERPSRRAIESSRRNRPALSFPLKIGTAEAPRLECVALYRMRNKSHVVPTPHPNNAPRPRSLPPSPPKLVAADRWKHAPRRRAAPKQFSRGRANIHPTHPPM